MRILHLYRPRLPAVRAQAIQVVHACHALAMAGHDVTLLADRGAQDAQPSSVLAKLNLSAPPNFHLQVSPWKHKGLAGLWFRRQLARWWRGAPGWIVARDKRRLWAAIERHPQRHRILLETHELDSALAAERHDDIAASQWHELEAKLLPHCHALVANCGGTLSAWQQTHGDALPALQRVCHNAISANRRRELHPSPDPIIRCVGSLRRYKGIQDLCAAADRLPLPLEFIGGSPAEQAALPPHANVHLQPPVAYPMVPDLLARSAALLLPLQDNLFGRSLTSPLKFWDYLATSAPLVVPDLPSIQEIVALTGAPVHRYVPGDVDSIHTAISQALSAPPRHPIVRTWKTRAAEMLALMEAP